MSFYAVIDSATGEIIEVCTSLDHPLPPGAVLVELPAPGDPVHLDSGHGETSGSLGHRVDLERARSEDDGRRGGGPSYAESAEQFFARLEHEIARADAGGRGFTLLLFDLAPGDRADARTFVADTLEAYGQELLPCDFIAHLRPHLATVLLPDVDAPAHVVPVRGAATALAYPRDRAPIEALRSRQHPLLRRSLYRSQGAA